MEGREGKLIKYIEGSKTRFIIPVYQRNYDWKEKNCEQLFDDLIKIVRGKRRSHFFGSIVSVHEGSGRNTEYVIIDGQQRVTTISLLFLAMYNLIFKGIIKPIDGSLGIQIYEEFLVDKYQTDAERIKLRPVKDDRVAFEKLFDGDVYEYVRESNLTINYQYFYNRIQKNEITIDELYDAICRLEIINITLSGEDNPQLIFESLNSTGLALSEGDKIRNFILMGLPADLQDDYYTKYWNRIEKFTNYDVTSFLRDYLTIKNGEVCSSKKIYTNFKQYVEDLSLTVEDLFKDLLDYAKRYGVLLNGDNKNDSLYSCIDRLNRLEKSVTRPFFLEVLRLYDEGELSISQVTDIFLITESYLFRRIICDMQTNVLNGMFSNLHREIMRYNGSSCENYLEKFKYVLLSKNGRASFPSNREFKKKFMEKQVYNMTPKNKIYILERFENYKTKECKNVYEKYDKGIYSIEHIMPRELTPAWIKDLGDNYREIHETWLHRIGNLTLTAYNSRYSNKTFKEKKTMENGFEDSGIRMNNYIAKNEKWTSTEIEERSKYLINQAIKIWMLPSSGFEPEKKQVDVYSLIDEDIDFSGKKIKCFSFRNAEYAVTSWIEMFQKVLQILYIEDRSVITKFATSSYFGIASYFSFNKSDFINSVEIYDGIHVNSCTSTERKLFILRNIFKAYDVYFNDLIFYTNKEK